MKTMKHLKLLFIAFVLISASMFGQTQKQKRAERQFDSFSFIKAIDTYEKLIDTSFNKYYAMRKLGDAYIMLRQPEKALPIYGQVVAQENVPSEYFLYYAQTLRATGDYDASKEWMKKYKDAGNKEDSRVKNFFKNDDLASGIFNSVEKNTLQKVNFNTKYNDFGAVVLNDQIYFASSRHLAAAVKRVYGWDNQPLLDIFQVSSEGGTIESTTQISGDINTIHHDGPGTFNADGTKMYFSRNNYYKNKKDSDEKGIMHVGIFTADLVDGKWENVLPTSLNNSGYIVYHPTLNKEGTKLYFASDMPGGFGGTDIYMSEISADGIIGQPKNLGAVVNTEGNEVFPYVHSENGTLYFSSDGFVGYGLLDVFASIKGENDEIVNVINLGEPINSKKMISGTF